MRIPRLGKGRLSLRRASRLALCLLLGGELHPGASHAHVPGWSFDATVSYCALLGVV